MHENSDTNAGLGDTRKRVHGSLYSTLRTNLPRHIMAYTDFPFTLDSPGPDTRLFPGHEEVIRHSFDPSQRLLQVQQVILLKLDFPCEEICSLISSSAIPDGASIHVPFPGGFTPMAALTVARHWEIA